MKERRKKTVKIAVIYFPKNEAFSVPIERESEWVGKKIKEKKNSKLTFTDIFNNNYDAKLIERGSIIKVKNGQIDVKKKERNLIFEQDETILLSKFYSD